MTRLVAMTQSIDRSPSSVWRPQELHSRTPHRISRSRRRIGRRKSRTSKNAKSRKWDFRTWKNEFGYSKTLLSDHVRKNMRKNKNFLKCLVIFIFAVICCIFSRFSCFPCPQLRAKEGFFEIRDFRRPGARSDRPAPRFPRVAALDLSGPPEAVRPNWASYRYSRSLQQA